MFRQKGLEHQRNLLHGDESCLQEEHDDEDERDVTIVATSAVEAALSGIVAQAETLTTEYVGTLPESKRPQDRLWVQATDEASSTGMGKASVVAQTKAGGGSASPAGRADKAAKVPNTADASVSAAALAAGGAVLWKAGRSLRSMRDGDV